MVAVARRLHLRPLLPWLHLLLLLLLLLRPRLRHLHLLLLRLRPLEDGLQ